MAPMSPSPAHAPACSECGRPMDANTAALRGGICEAPDCEAARIRAASRAGVQREWDQYRDKLRRTYATHAPAIAAAAGAAGVAPKRTTFLAIPLQTRPMTEPDDARREAFLDHLARIVGQAFRADPPDTVRHGSKVAEAPEAAVTQAACATCKGHCCRLGGTSNAFLDADAIARFRARNPDLSPDQVIAAYADRLAPLTPEGACLFQGDRGCTLDRDQRADYCNVMYCRDLFRLLKVDTTHGPGPFTLVATDDDIGRSRHRPRRHAPARSRRSIPA